MKSVHIMKRSYLNSLLKANLPICICAISQH